MCGLSLHACVLVGLSLRLYHALCTKSCFASLHKWSTFLILTRHPPCSPFPSMPPQEGKQASELMARWADIDIADALELLSPSFTNPEVGLECNLLSLRETDKEEDWKKDWLLSQELLYNILSFCACGMSYMWIPTRSILMNMGLNDRPVTIPSSVLTYSLKILCQAISAFSLFQVLHTSGGYHIPRRNPE